MTDDLPDYRSNVVPFSKLDTTNLSGNFAGGGGDGMEPRIARLEADVSHLKTRADEASRKLDSLSAQMTDFKVDVAVLTERVNHLPSKTYAIVTAVAMVAAIASLILFADRLKTALGLG